MTRIYHSADFYGAKQYALERLARDLPGTLFYHSLWHTQEEVTGAANQLAAEQEITGHTLMLLQTAVYFHDIGFTQQRVNHEAISAQIAARILPHFGYCGDDIRRIEGMIMATKLPQSPKNALEQIIADADLDVLGRTDFRSRNQALRDELAVSGAATIDLVWYGTQLQFMQRHRYFTRAERALRDARKAQNIAKMFELLQKQQRLGLKTAASNGYPALLR